MPEVRDLAVEECQALLSRNAVARLAYSFHDRVDVVPIHYVYDGGWLYGRATPGPKIIPIRHNHWVAVEVDEVEGDFEWRSVVVRGSVYFLEEDGSPAEREAQRRAITLLRRIVPETATPADPVSQRTVIFRVHADEMTGRAARGRQ
ncbi:MAG TPA: pyridoxamine 5'-phosphate oxidase family protein [Gemmatimonadaceae bacterium]|nr:pyridoxamine 5'-phosphate oxidase family protein [Gemmatimonadaceae bacterium]